MADVRSEVIAIRLTAKELEVLDAMMIRGKHSCRAVLARSIVLEMLDDDARSHGEPGLMQKQAVMQ